ncbi:hypothetical protein RSAG8_12063, partial [Rhizoctonia solani AG-8 WAC10335]
MNTWASVTASSKLNQGRRTPATHLVFQLGSTKLR